RSSFRDWAAECTDAPREVCELALAHVNTNSIEAAYRRSDLFERRRERLTVRRDPHTMRSGRPCSRAMPRVEKLVRVSGGVAWGEAGEPGPAIPFAPSDDTSGQRVLLDITVRAS
ncbi:MAG: hypothetical protein OXC19_14545, partial [Bryobacterales bacterium]|nr:hypothetical protein [Bryobacterales bacterium]